MSRIVLAWELGNNLGHVAGFLPLGQELRRRGHQLILILQNLSQVSSLPLSSGLSLLQAPLWQGNVPASPPANYAEILLHYGFLEPDGLSALVNAWRNLFTLINPNLVIFDHAPTALLASRGLSLSRALLGTGFCSPPRLSPFPPMRWWQPHSEQVLTDNEAAILSTANKVLARHDVAPMAQLTDLFEVDEDFLCTVRELDHYPQRDAKSRYWGPRFAFGGGHLPTWTAGAGKRVFAYLDPSYDGLQSLLRDLADLDAQVLVYIPNLAAAEIPSYPSSRLRFIATSVDLERIAGHCDVGITHAGHGTSSALLLAGIPLLLLPLQLEQFMTAMNVANLGAGIALHPEQHPKDHAGALQRLLADPAYALRAQDFAARYDHEAQAQRVQKIANRCEQLLAQPTPSVEHHTP